MKLTILTLFLLSLCGCFSIRESRITLHKGDSITIDPQTHEYEYNPAVGSAQERIESQRYQNQFIVEEYFRHD